MTDGAGVPLAVIVAEANRVDFKLAAETLAALVVPRPEPSEARPQGLCLDRGYDYTEVYELLEAQGYTPHIRPCGGDVWVRAPEHEARRWVVERSHSWMNRYRSLLIRWAKKAGNFLGLLQLACALITLKQADLLG